GGLRADWLRQRGKRGGWENFARELPLLAQDDLDIRCYGWLSRLARGDEGVFGEAREMWLEPRELPDSCASLGDKMATAEKLTVPDVWRRVRVLLENGQLAPARRAVSVR